MIVSPLKSNVQFSLVFLIVLCGAIWISTFTYTGVNTEGINYKEHVLFDLLIDNNYSFYVNQLINLLVVVIGAFSINFLAIEQEMISKINFLPAFFYIIFSFSASTNKLIEPILVANIFVIPALYYLIDSYRKEYALQDVFKSSLLMGLGSFFCIHYIVVFPILYIALFILRPFSWREWISGFIGLTLPLYIYVCVSYLVTGQPFEIFNMIQEAVISIQKPILSPYYVAFIIITLLIFLLSFFNYLNKGFGGKVKTQKAKYVLLWMLVLCGLMVFFEQASDMILLPCIIPLSIFMGDYLAEIKQHRFANILVMLFIISFLVISLHALKFIS